MFRKSQTIPSVSHNVKLALQPLDDIFRWFQPLILVQGVTEQFCIPARNLHCLLTQIEKLKIISRGWAERNYKQVIFGWLVQKKIVILTWIHFATVNTKPRSVYDEMFFFAWTLAIAC